MSSKKGFLKVIANVDNHDEFRDEDFVWGSTKTTDQQLYHSMRWSSQQFYHIYMMPKNLTVE